MIIENAKDEKCIGQKRKHSKQKPDALEKS